jgi:hypothetical protein
MSRKIKTISLISDGRCVREYRTERGTSPNCNCRP